MLVTLGSSQHEQYLRMPRTFRRLPRGAPTPVDHAHRRARGKECTHRRRMAARRCNVQRGHPTRRRGAIEVHPGGAQHLDRLPVAPPRRQVQRRATLPIRGLHVRTRRHERPHRLRATLAAREVQWGAAPSIRRAQRSAPLRQGRHHLRVTLPGC